MGCNISDSEIQQMTSSRQFDRIAKLEANMMTEQEVKELIDRAGDEKDQAINDLIDENKKLFEKMERMKKEIQKLKDCGSRAGLDNLGDL